MEKPVRPPPTGRTATADLNSGEDSPGLVCHSASTVGAFSACRVRLPPSRSRDRRGDGTREASHPGLMCLPSWWMAACVTGAEHRDVVAGLPPGTRSELGWVHCDVSQEE